ncbi:MAG: futalosine hydrolase [Planctomycetota bacterium]
MRLGEEDAVLVVGGVGLAAAGARAAAAIARHRPRRVVLAGIAGSFDLARAPLGAVIRGLSAAVDGIGAGEGPGHVPLEAMGFEPLPGLGRHPFCSPGAAPGARRGPILSVTAASDAGLAAARRRRHPTALAEDMESWAVALAAREAGLPLLVLRAISNAVGDRDVAGWRVGEALARLRGLLRELPSP